MGDLPSKRSLSLGTRTFLVSAVAIILSLGIALAVSWFVGERIARDTAAKALSGTRAAQEHYQRLQLRELQLISGLLAADPYFASYVAEATLGGIHGESEADVRSISDLLRDRQQEFGFDLAMVLNDAGELLVRTDRPIAASRSVDSPLVQRVLDDLLPAAGLWAERERLYQVAVVPLARNDLLTGFLVTGLAIGDELANEIKRAGGSDVLFLGRHEEQWSTLASTMDVAVSERLEGALIGVLTGPSRSAGGFEVAIDGDDWLAQITPLTDEAGEILGAAVSLRSLDAELAPFRSIQRWLLLAAGAGLIVALVTSLVMARRAVRPVRELVEAAEAAADGDYQMVLDPSSGDEIGRLADAIDRLLSRLREKQDMEDYVQDVSRFLPDPSTDAPTRTQTSGGPAKRLHLDVLAIRLPQYANKDIDGDGTRLARDFGRDVEELNARLMDQGGEVLSTPGPCVIAVFPAESQPLPPIHGAAGVFSRFTDCGIAWVRGEVVRGGAAMGGAALIGAALLRCLRLLAECGPGQLMMAPDLVKQHAASFEALKLVPVIERGRISAKGFYTLSARSLLPLAAGGEQPRKSTGAARRESLVAGEWLGSRYQVLGMLGRGGMGEVYKARDEELGDVVALKLLRPDLLSDPKPLERLKEELKIARSIAHTNVLRTYDFGEQDGVAYISMEYVRGLTLRYLLKQRGKLPYSAGLRIARQLCDGLAAAHAAGIVHRDIKPENLIIEQSGNLKLMDFGIARPLRREAQGLTQPGSFIGTPHYVAPEVMQGNQPDHRADLYSVGIVFNEMFTGELPFAGDNTMEISIAHIQDPPRPASEIWSDIPPPLEQVILRCLAKRPDDRFQTALDVRHALDALRG